MNFILYFNIYLSAGVPLSDLFPLSKIHNDRTKKKQRVKCLASKGNGKSHVLTGKRQTSNVTRSRDRTDIVSCIQVPKYESIGTDVEKSKAKIDHEQIICESLSYIEPLQVSCSGNSCKMGRFAAGKSCDCKVSNANIADQQSNETLTPSSQHVIDKPYLNVQSKRSQCDIVQSKRNDCHVRCASQSNQELPLNNPEHTVTCTKALIRLCRDDYHMCVTTKVGQRNQDQIDNISKSIDSCDGSNEYQHQRTYIYARKHSRKRKLEDPKESEEYQAKTKKLRSSMKELSDSQHIVKQSVEDGFQESGGFFYHKDGFDETLGHKDRQLKSDEGFYGNNTCELQKTKKARRGKRKKKIKNKQNVKLYR